MFEGVNSRERIAVIADDITGAAEMAGIGLRFGLPVSLIVRWPQGDGTEAERDEVGETGLTVIATDTRSMAEADAVVLTRKIARRLKDAGVRKVFKKTDSVLRGHVAAELKALMDACGMERAMYLPQNPSRQRVIREGIYRVDGKPLHDTGFRDDPEYPARTSVVRDMLGGNVSVVDLSSPWPATGMLVGNAVTGAEMTSYAQRLKKGRSEGREWLPAGAADFFTAWLTAEGYGRPDGPETEFAGLGGRRALIVCGSTVDHGIGDFDYVKRHGIPVCRMPEALFLGSGETEPGLSDWCRELKSLYEKAGALILTVGYPSQGGKPFAERLRRTTAEAAARLIAFRRPEELVIEGGATAFALMERLGWDRFRITDQLVPGVVRMIPAGEPRMHVTIKPGSYPWGDRLFR